MFSELAKRQSLTAELHAGRLRPRDLVRDNYEHFEGGLRLDPSGVWVYGVGS